MALAVAQLVVTTPWARGRLVAAILVLGLDQAVFVPASGDDAVNLLGAVTGILGAALVSTAVLGLLRASISDSRSTLVELNQRVELVEQRNRHDRERLHEINAALAGIATASRLIHEESRLPVERRARLVRLVDSELDRLQGLGQRTVPQIRAVALDDTVETIVTTQRILGRTVHWSPTGRVVLGRAEHIAEVLTTLLENVARHASGSRS